MTCDAYCEGCYYFGAAHQTCDYWEKADELRGCPAGKGCTKRITKKEYMKMGAPKSWNKAAGYEMWKAGKSDKEIGNALGVTAQAVSQCRKKYWEPDKAKEAEPEVEEAPQSGPAGMEPNIPEISEPEDAAEDTVEDYEPESVAEEDPEELDARLMIRALENFVRDLKGMRAVLTFQVLQQLWNWKTVEDLKAAQTFLEGLIELERGNV